MVRSCGGIANWTSRMTGFPIHGTRDHGSAGPMGAEEIATQRAFIASSISTYGISLRSAIYASTTHRAWGTSMAGTGGHGMSIITAIRPVVVNVTPRTNWIFAMLDTSD